MRGRRIVACLAALQLAAGPTPARAQPKQARLLLVVEGGDEPGPRKIGTDLAAELTSEGVRLVRLESFGDGRSGPDPSARARTLFEQAQKRLKEARFDLALSLLAKAKSGASLSTLRKIHLTEAHVRQALGQGDGARGAMETYAILGGEAPDDTFYAPEFVRMYAAAKKSLSKRPRATLSVRPLLPPGVSAQLFLNGRPAGRTPLELADLPAGIHHLKIEANGFERFEKWFALRPGRHAVEPALGAAAPMVVAATALQEERGDERSRLLALLQEITQTDGIILIDAASVGAVKKGTLSWSRPRAEAGATAREDARRIRDAVLGRVPVSAQPAPLGDSPWPAVAAAPEPGLPEAEPPPAAEGPRWYRRWWVWTIAGSAAAAAGGTAAYLMLRPSGSSGTVQLSVRPR